MKRLSLFLIAFICVMLLFSSKAFSQGGNVIDIPITEKGDTLQRPNRSAPILILEGTYDPLQNEVLLSSYGNTLGLLEVCLRNESTCEYKFAYMETSDQTSIPISGSPGYYTITIYTEDDRVFWGEFWINI